MKYAPLEKGEGTGHNASGPEGLQEKVSLKEDNTILDATIDAKEVHIVMYKTIHAHLCHQMILRLMCA